MSGRRLLLAAVAAGLLLTSLDAYVVAGLFFPMVTDTGVPLDHLEQATPILTAFFFGYVVAIPLLGSLSDSVGRGPVYAAGLLLFAAGSAVTAQAQDPTALIVGRGLQGFAGGALVPVAVALVADAYSGPARLLALGAVAGAQELGSLAGPVYGVAMAQWGAALGGWRAVFWLNLPLAGACAALLAWRWRAGLPEAERRGAAWASGLALAAGMGFLVLALSPDAPARSAVSSRALPLGAAAASALVGFGLLQRRAGAALISGPAARAPGLRFGVAANLLSGAALVAVLAEVPILAHTLFGLDDVASALLLGRFLGGVALGAILGGVLGSRGRAPVAVVGLLLAAGCFVRMAGWGALAPYQHLGPFSEAQAVLIACGLGFGLAIAPIVASVLEGSRGDEHGAAASLAVLARMAGMLIGVALLAAYGLHRFYSDLAGCAPGGFGVGSLVSGSFRACAAASVQHQYHDVFLIAAVAAGLAAAASFKLSPWPRPSTSR